MIGPFGPNVSRLIEITMKRRFISIRDEDSRLVTAISFVAHIVADLKMSEGNPHGGDEEAIAGHVLRVYDEKGKQKERRERMGLI